MHLPALGDLAENVPVARIVIDNQHRQSAQVFKRRELNWTSAAFSRPAEPVGEVKDRTHSRVAFQPDFAAHQLYDLLGDGQPQPGAPKLASRG